MKQNYYILGLLITCICISLILTYHYFEKTNSLEVPLVVSDVNVEYEYQFVLIVQELESQYLQELFEGAQNAAVNHKANIEYWGTKQTNIEDHIKLIEIAIASKVDGILTQGLSDEFEPVIHKALNKGIPLIMVDSNLESNNELVPYVGTNNYQAGFELGRTVLEETEGETKIGILTGSMLANNLKERVQGFQDAISKEKRMNVVSIESSNLSKIQGAEKTYHMLRENPEISIFFGTSALDSLGITEGIRKFNPTKDIQVYSFDTLEETIELIKKEDIHVTLKQEPYEMGFTGVNLLVTLSQGEQIKNEYYTSTMLLRKEDVEDEY